MEREVTARLRAAQDEAYAESLAADQEKERRRAAELAARLQLEREAETQQQQQELRRLEVLPCFASPHLTLPRLT